MAPTTSHSSYKSTQNTTSAVVHEPATEFKQLDRSIFSFQRTSAKNKTSAQPSTGSNKDSAKSNANKGTTSRGGSFDLWENVDNDEAIPAQDAHSSAAKKLFPNITIPLSPIRDGAEDSPVPHQHSDSQVPLTTASSLHSLSVYDMTPEMLQHIIEEKSRDQYGSQADLNSYVGSFTSRENTGFNNNNNNNSNSAKNNARLRNLYPNSLGTSAALPSLTQQARSLQLPSHVPLNIAAQGPPAQDNDDLEMGNLGDSAVSPTNKSQLMEEFRNGTVGSVSNSNSIGREYPFRKQSGNVKIPTAPATVRRFTVSM